jgi:transposase
MPSREPVRRRKRRLRWSPARRCTNKRLTEQGRGAVLALYREGLNKSQVAQRVGVTRWSVTRVLRRNDLIEKGKFRDRRCGKKSTVSAAIKARRTKVKMMMKEREDRRLKYSGAVALRQSGEFTVSSRTLQRDVNATGFKYGPRKKAPALTKAQRERRLELVGKLSRFRARRVLFSDEAKVDTKDYRLYGWSGPGRRGESKYRLTEKYSKKVDVWGMVGVGVKVLRVLGPKLRFTSATYKEIIRKPLLAALQKDPDLVFQQDGCKGAYVKK